MPKIIHSCDVCFVEACQDAACLCYMSLVDLTLTYEYQHHSLMGAVSFA